MTWFPCDGMDSFDGLASTMLDSDRPAARIREHQLIDETAVIRPLRFRVE